MYNLYIPRSTRSPLDQPDHVTRLSTEVAPYVTHGTYIKRCPPRGSTIVEQLLSLRSPGHVCVRNKYLLDLL
jgi:hypothetical protein